ncbi:MAG: glucosaminidase domain-containing protein [Chloroflexota bacterium]
MSSEKRRTRQTTRNDHKQVLTEMYKRPSPPLRQPPRLVERHRGLLDDVEYDGRRTQSRRLPEHVNERQGRTGPIIAPLSKASAELEEMRAFHERRLIERDFAASRSSAFDVLRHPGFLVLVAVVSILLILVNFPSSASTLSGYFGVGGTSEPETFVETTAPDLVTPPGEHSVIGQPTVSASFIDTVLAQYSSPANGTGEIWMSLGRQYGIDPAYALAFFIHESSAGTNPGWAGMKPDGSTTHNVGNIICAGYPTCFGRFRDYNSWEEGIEDWYRLISKEYIGDRQAHTVEQIIPIYAPSIENNVPAYVGAVTNMVNEWRSSGVAQ